MAVTENTEPIKINISLIDVPAGPSFINKCDQQ
jgi:hypothetical protein